MNARALLCALIPLLLASCSPSASATPHASVPAPRIALAAPHDLFGSLLAHSKDLGPARGRVDVMLLLKDRNAAARARTLAAIYNPHSPLYGKYERAADLTVLSTGALARITRILHGAGLALSPYRGEVTMIVWGAAGTVDRTFGVSIHDYRSPSGVRFYAAPKGGTVPRALRPWVAAVGRISSYAARRRAIVPIDGMSPADLMTAYDMIPLQTRHMDGTGQTVAFIETDGFKQADFDAFTAKFGLPRMVPKVMTGSPLRNVDGEAELDMEVVHEIAPRAKLLVYNCASPCGDADIVAVENLIVHDNGRSIISVSLGGCEPGEDPTNAKAEAAAFSRADVLGESVFVASGDSGAYECLTENWGAPPTSEYIGASSPATTPGVTAVGGTRLSLNANSTWRSEEAWVDPPELAGTGGGTSVYFSRPSWQNAPGVQTGGNGSAMREVPDVAAAADPLSSAQINVDGNWTEEGGTSQAAPIWAGMTALINQYLKGKRLHAVGFMNPALYALARSTPRYPPFHDITLGNNLVNPAGPGYDLATGLGSPDAWNLARDLQAYMGGAR